MPWFVDGQTLQEIEGVDVLERKFYSHMVHVRVTTDLKINVGVHVGEVRITDRERYI